MYLIRRILYEFGQYKSILVSEKRKGVSDRVIHAEYVLMINVKVSLQRCVGIPLVDWLAGRRHFLTPEKKNS